MSYVTPPRKDPREAGAPFVQSLYSLYLCSLILLCSLLLYLLIILGVLWGAQVPGVCFMKKLKLRKVVSQDHRAHWWRHLDPAQHSGSKP